MKKAICYITCFVFLIEFCIPGIGLAKEQLAVMDLQANHEVETSLAEALSEEIRNEIHSFGDYEVLSGDDLRALSKRTILQQKLGCMDNQCLISFGQKIGTKYMVAGSVSKIGKIYSINLKLMDTEGENVGVKNRVSEKCKGKEEELFRTARDAAAKLMGKKVVDDRSWYRRHKWWIVVAIALIAGGIAVALGDRGDDKPSQPVVN